MALSHNPRIVTDGLVLALDAANPKSYPGTGTTWYDMSRNGNDGALINGVGYSAANKGVFTFDGVNDYCTIPYDASMNTSYITLSLWIKSTFTIGPKSRHYIFYGLSHNSMIFVDEPDEINFAIFTGGNFITLDKSHPNIADNNWHNIVGTYSNTETRIYVDGDSIASSSSQGAIDAANGDGRLMDYIGGAYNTEGLASYFSMYNRAITEVEVKQNYNALKGRYGL